MDRGAFKDRRKAPLYRSWWTRERVLLGLRRLYADTGQAPNCAGPEYRRLMRECGQHGLKGGRRRYPADQAVLRHWPTFAHAWRELGITPDGRRLLSTPPERGGVGWVGRHEAGERHGRLTVVELAGYYCWGKDGKVRTARWRCVCDCGREEIVRAGNFNRKRECRRCGAVRGHARRRAQAEAARQAAAEVQASVPRASSSLAGAGAPRATSPGKPAERGGLEPVPALFSSSTQEQA